MAALRAWQQTALSSFQASTGNFLCVATPGAGKTFFALTAFKYSGAQRLIVVVPTDHLKTQWTKAAHDDFGIELDKTIASGRGDLARDYNGFVITYAAVASNPVLWKRLAGHSAFVIFDEVHHAGDALSWGDAVSEAFETVHRRLLLSGTPFRHDDKYIPFVEYESDGEGGERCKAHHSYGYGDALEDKVVRPIQFPLHDGATWYEYAGQRFEHGSLKQLVDDELSHALRTAFSPSNEWVPSVFRQAHEDLAKRRVTVPDAGGLILAPDKETAKAYAALMGSIAGVNVPVATSDAPEASQIISAFSTGKAPWLVAVRMVSEGVDIRRLVVGVYASTYKTELFFRQAVGRFVRRSSFSDKQHAALYIPAIEPLVEHALSIEDEANAISMKRREPDDGEDGGGDGPGGAPIDTFIPGSAGEGVHTETIFGETFSVAQIEEFRVEHEIPDEVPEATAVSLMRKFGVTGTVGAGINPVPTSVPRVEEKIQVRSTLRAKVNHRAKRSYLEHRQVHAILNRICQDDANSATLESLKRRIEILADDRYWG